jgi:hypothetical protein
MSELRPISHWGLWMHMHEPAGLSLRQQFVVHFWANWEMLKRPRDLAISSLFALIPSAALTAVVWLARPHRRGGPLQALAGDQTLLLLVMAGVIVAWLAAQHLFFVYSMQRWYAPFVRRELCRRGFPMCERCGHRLPQATPATCPECGVPLPRAQESKAVSG